MDEQCMGEAVLICFQNDLSSKSALEVRKTLSREDIFTLPL